MRRPLALTLVLLFGWMLIAPLLAPSAEANLPPCCRRHGKHHCAMLDVFNGLRPGFSNIREQCPFQRAIRSAAHTTIYRPQPLNFFFAHRDVSRPRAVQGETLRHLDFARSRMQRGPPLFPLCNS